MGNLTKSMRFMLLAAGTGLLTSAGWGASWTVINTGLPGIGLGVTSLVIDPASPATVYAITSSSIGIGLPVSGLYKTTDSGASWKPVSSVSDVRSLAIDPQNSSAIYAGTAHGLLKSVNGGESWADASDGLPSGPVNRLAIDPISPSTLYAVATAAGPVVNGPAGSTGIFKTTDGAASWRMLNTGLPGDIFIGLLVVDPVNPATIYLSTPPFGPFSPGQIPKGTILKSTDGGESWTPLDTGAGPPGYISSLTIDPKSPSTLYAVAPVIGGPIAILKSTDEGVSWNRLSGVPANVSAANLVLDPTAPSTIYASAAMFGPSAPPRAGVLKSADGGQHWSFSDLDLPANTSINSLLLDPLTPSRIYVGMIGFSVNGASGPAGGVLQSTDGGISWKSSSDGLIAFDIRTVAADPADASTIYAGGFGGTFKSSDGGATWNATGLKAYTGFLLADVLSPHIVYAQTGKGFGCSSVEHLLLRTTDGGGSWQDNVSPENSGCVLNVAFGAVHAAPMAIDPSNSNTLYLAESDDIDGYSAIIKSTDGGANWTVAWDWFKGLHGKVQALAVDPARSGTIYAGIDGELRGLFKSTDGGATWSSTGLAQNAVTLVTLDPSRSLTLYAVAGGSGGQAAGFRGVFKSTDGGTAWTEMDSGLTDLIGSPSTTGTALIVDRADPNTLYLGTSNAGVFRSVDGGAHWSAYNDGLENLQIRGLAPAAKGSRALYAATGGGVFKIAE